MKIIKICSVVFLLTCIHFSCSKETLSDIDTNPNILLDPPLNALLPDAIISYSNEIAGGDAAVAAGMMAEITSGVLGFNNYTDLERSSAEAWENGYLLLNQLAAIKAKALDKQATVYAGIADVLKAFTLANLVDLYGDIPYSEALTIDIRNPKFDAPQNLYSEIQATLDLAIDNLNKTGAAAPGKDDLVFNGDKDMWTKTAYGLRARLYNRLSNVDGAISAQNALTAINNSFSNTSEGFSVNVYNNSIQNGNPYSVNQNIQPQSAVGNVYDVMLAFTPNNVIEEDPRSIIWFSTIGGVRLPAPSGTAKSDFGQPRLDGAVYSKPLFLKYFEAPLPLLSYTELLFIKAEANFRLGNIMEAYDAYLAGVEAALKESSDFSPDAQISPADIVNYLNYPEVAMGEANLTMEAIIKQKYIYLFKMQWIEAYNESRKYVFFPAANPFGRANRMVYPISEVTRNPNTPAAVNFNTIFENSTKLFWAK